MTDAQLSKIVSAVQERPRGSGSDNKVFLAILGGVISVVGGFFVTVVGGIAMFFLTQSLDKTDQSSQSTIALSAQMGGVEKQVDHLSSQITDLRSQLANSRVDPFTGADGMKLREDLREFTKEEVAEVARDVERLRVEFRGN